MWLLLLCFLKAPIVCVGLISWVKSGEHQKASDNQCWLTCSRSYYFPFSERVLIFPLSPLVFLSPSIHPACVGGIKVALLSSKLQISFASVHLTLCFITEARGGRRFRSALHKVMTPTGCYSPLSLTPPLLHSLAGWGLFLWSCPYWATQWRLAAKRAAGGCDTCVTSCHQNDKVVIVVFAQPDPERIT